MKNKYGLTVCFLSIHLPTNSVCRHSGFDSWCHDAKRIHRTSPSVVLFFSKVVFFLCGLFEQYGGFWCGTSNVDMSHKAVCLCAAAQLGTVAPESSRWNVM